MDTSGFVALVSAGDRNHRSADAIIRQAVAARATLLTTNLIVAETHRLLLFRAGIRAARAAVERILASSNVELLVASKSDHDQALVWLDKLSDQRITYTDASSFAVMDRLGCRRVVSFDHDFLIAGFEIVQPPER